VIGDGIDELSEVFTDWKIDQNILEQTNEVIRGEAADTLKAVELAQWIQSFLGDTWILIVLNSGDEGNNVLDLIVVHHFLHEL
jgi:hypothetical protein